MAADAYIRQLLQSIAGMPDRDRWNAMNEAQAKLYLANGRKVDHRQAQLIRLMQPIAPLGYEGV